MIDDDALLPAFTEEFQALCADPQPLLLELRKADAWIVAAQLQLALRHPANTGPTALLARGIVRRIHDAVATTPTLRVVAQRGDDPARDEAPTDPQWAANTLAQILEHLSAHAPSCSSCTNWIRGHGGTVARP